MANLAQQFVLEMTAPRAWFLLLLPLFFLLVRYSLATLFGANRARKQQQLRLPPSPPALPVLGHLHLVGSVPHVSLGSLAKKHGLDLMLLRLGAVPVLVVSSPPAAEAVLRTHDHVFASRPSFLAVEIILYGPSDVGFAPYGDSWRQARKLVTTHLLTAKKVRSFRLAREEEVSMVMSQIGEAAAGGAAVNVSELLSCFTNDLACRAVMGKSFRSDGRNKLFRELVADTSPLIAGFNVEEFFPILARFGVFSKVVRAKSERMKRRWDELLDSLIQDHESKYDTSEDDFIHILLSVREEYDLKKEQMKAILLDVFFAGIETSSSLLDFTMAELMRKPDVMSKLQAEVRRQITPGGEEALISEADITDMPYLKAVIKESLRLHPPVPLLPHFSMASCSIDGYKIPPRVRVLVNAWAMGRDSRFWEETEEFIPERFLDGGSATHVSFTGNDFQFLPFGAGRRMCSGMNFGLAAVEVMLANLMRCFDWEMPPGQEARRDIDMSDEFGIVTNRKQKLLLVPKLRGLCLWDRIDGYACGHLCNNGHRVSMVMSQIGEAAAGGAAVDMSELLSCFTNDLACRAVMGKSFRSDGWNKLFRELVADTSPLIAGFNVEEFFPFLARFGVLSKVVRAKSERMKRRWDELLDSLIQNHESKYDTSEDDFIHILLSVREEYDLKKEQMKAILLDVFFAGIETSSSLLDFTMAELMRKPDVMKKLQAEVRRQITPDSEEALISEADITDMPYLKAVIKESIRLHPPLPLLPHFSMASCSIDGYKIPPRVRVLVNAWAMGRDARFWEEAEEFIPERFLDGGDAAHVSFTGNDFQFLPFGAGRRMCPGMNFGVAAVEVMLANLMRCFDWEMPPGQEARRDIDMSEVFGIVTRRKEKLLLVPKLRITV
ncbi:hypothetical protein ACP70R_008110 [Stipagrostis hirtigluma subsp. patula]